MSLSLGLIVKRLPLVLHGRHRVSLLEGGGAIVLVDVNRLGLGFSVQTDEGDAWADHRGAECVRYSLFLAGAPRIVNMHETSLEGG